MQHALDDTAHPPAPLDFGAAAPLDVMQFAIDTLWRRIGTLLSFLAVGLAAGGIALVMMPPSYSGEAMVQLNFSRNATTSGLPSQQIANVDGAILVETAARVIRSRTTAQAVVERLHLDTDPAFVSSSRLANFFQGLSLSSGQATARENMATAALVRSLRITYEPRSYLVTIRCTLGDPDRAALVANAVAVEYLRSRVRAQLTDEIALADQQMADLSRTYGLRHPQLQSVVSKRDSLRVKLAQLGTDAEPAGLITALIAETYMPATAVNTPTGPNAPLILALTLVGSLLAGILAAFAVDRLYR